jgi:tetratricopeptide (TPR) repeat protein
LLLIGITANLQREFERARELLDESVLLFRDLGDEHYTLEATRFLAWTHGELGSPDQAQRLLEDNLRRARALGDKHIEATALEQLEGYAVLEGRLRDACELLNGAYRVNRQLGDAYRLPFIVCRFGRVLARAGMAGAAACVLASGQALLEEMGASEDWAERMNEQTLASIRTQLDEAAFAEAWEQGRKLTADEAVALALDSFGEHADHTQAGSRSRGARGSDECAVP